MTPLLILALAAVVILLATRRAPAPDVTPTETPAPTRPCQTTCCACPNRRGRAWALLCTVHDALRSEPADARAAFLLRQTLSDYLPDTVRAFLHLTPRPARSWTRRGSRRRRCSSNSCP